MSSHNFVANTGTAGQVLTSNGPSTTPSYQTPSASFLALTPGQVVIAVNANTAGSFTNQAIDNNSYMLKQTATAAHAALTTQTAVTAGYGAGIEATDGNGNRLIVAVDGTGVLGVYPGEAIYQINGVGGASGHLFLDGTLVQLAISDAGIRVLPTTLPNSIPFAVEEAAWTPALLSPGTLVSPTINGFGRWQKIGNFCEITFYVEFEYTSGGATGNPIAINGLPFTYKTGNHPPLYHLLAESINGAPTLSQPTILAVSVLAANGTAINSGGTAFNVDGNTIYFGTLADSGSGPSTTIRLLCYPYPAGTTGTMQRLAGSFRYYTG